MTWWVGSFGACVCVCVCVGFLGDWQEVGRGRVGDC